MYLAINRFSVVIGKEKEFERIWQNRESYLDDVSGFKAFNLLRGSSDDTSTIYLSHSQWESEAAFLAWTKSDAFRKAHRNAGTPKGILMGHPVLECFNAVSTKSDD